MSISEIGATPEPQQNKTLSANKQEEFCYSVFDKEPQDGTVSIEEQKNAFWAKVNKNNTLIVACKQLKINIGEFFNNFAGYFKEIKTNGTQESAENANKLVEKRVLEFCVKLSESILEKSKNEEKQPPSINTEKGLVSDECMSYFIGKIVNMGLDINEKKLVDMNHDFDGNVKDTHALDFLANKYAKTIKNN